MADDAAWVSQAVAAASGLFGVAIGMLSQFWAQKRERSWRLSDENRSLKIQRGEELYSLVRKWWHNQITWFGHSKLCMKGVIDYNSFLDLSIDSNNGIDLKVDRIDLIFSVYFREVEPCWRHCLEQIQSISSVENDFKNDYKKGISSGQAKLFEMQAGMLKLGDHVERTLNLLARKIRIGASDLINLPSLGPSNPPDYQSP